MDVQHQANFRVFPEVPLDGLPGIFIGIVVGGVIVDGAIVDHTNALFLQEPSHFVADGQHVVLLIQGAEGLGFFVGAAGGLGDKIARTLHAQGAIVALTDMRAEPMEKLKAELGNNAEVFVANLTNPEDVKSLVANVEEKLGRIDILVNNAGLTRDNLFIRMSDEEWQLVLDVNLSAGFKLARAAVRGMMKRRFGRIIGIASVV